MSRAGRLLGTGTLVALLILLTVEPTGRTASTNVWLPSFKGLNYGVPLTVSGGWVGTAWLQEDHWSQVGPAMAADLDFVERHHLGRVIRLFIALDQLLNWDAARGFAGFDARALTNLNQALDLFDRHGIRIVAVLFDQEVVSSPGNFRFEALDGHHEAMRAGYLRATEEFLRTLRGRSTIAAIDLFNEAYSSLGTAGGLPQPPAADPITPGFPTATVHQFLRDLYASAKQTEPQIPLTVSDATLYWQPQPELSLYDDVLDFYDVHVYDDHPNLRNLMQALDKPYIIGEAGAAVTGQHFTDQVVEASAVRVLLEQGREDGARAVLIHSIANQNIFPATRDRLTPTGRVLSQFGESSAAGRPSVWPIVVPKRPLVLFVTSLAPSLSGTAPRRSSRDSGRETAWRRRSRSATSAGP